MSPLELPGKSFGFLPDRRNTTCDNCGRSFRDFLLAEGEQDLKKGVVRLKCPYCKYQLEVVDKDKVHPTKTEGEEEGKKKEAKKEVKKVKKVKPKKDTRKKKKK